MAHVTQTHLAKHLGVSQALVARALKNDPAVAQATRDRVQAEAARLGYRPNVTARALLTGRTGLVGLWISRPYGSYAARLIFGFEKLAQAAGVDLLIRDLGPQGQAEEMTARHIGLVDGLIVVDAPWHVETLLRSGASSRPCVGLGSTISPRADGVAVDLFRGAGQALKHLREVGCRRIAYLRPEHPLGDREDRRRAYVRAVRLPEEIAMEDATRAAAHAALTRHLKAHGCPDAVFCHNDDYALGALRALRELNLRVPRDVAVVGCDGVEDTEYLESPLTTIALPFDDMCRRVWTFLRERMDGYAGRPRRIRLMPELRVRGSSLRG